MNWHERVHSLPATRQESLWIHERLETLTVRESIILSAAMMRHPPESGADVINHMSSLPDYEVCSPAGGYTQLGQFYLDYETSVPKALQKFVDKEQLGIRYENEHPGLFIGSCYVQYPTREPSIKYDGTNLDALEDNSWSVKLKLASEQNRNGVWLRLPDYSDMGDGRPDEIRLALDELGADTIDDCSVLDAKCVLPEVGDLMSQYHSLDDLIYDGQNLGFALDEKGQGMPNFMERFAAALEYENCTRLDFAIDISQNLACYSFVPASEIKDFAKKGLHDQGMPDDILSSGCVKLEAFAEDMLERQGYILTKDESAYIGRNERQFIREHSQEQLSGMIME
ncbi:MAG: hypothetical protein PHU76_01765 [Synergistaceae bacterium]|nr:hypothetical protein [Proteiniphilum sp.]MDD3963167.1 hypothetical protein [Synergistaceae bacterium]